MNQLSLLDQFDKAERVEILTDKAYNLLDMLNDGAKKSEDYFMHDYFGYEDLVILIAKNKSGDLIGNVLTEKGETPKDFDVCWRILPIIRNELLKYEP